MPRVVPDVPKGVVGYQHIRRATLTVEAARQDAAVASVVEYVVGYGDVAVVRAVHAHVDDVLGEVAVCAVDVLHLVVACRVAERDALHGHVTVAYEYVRRAGEHDAALPPRLGAYCHALFGPARVSRQVDVAVCPVGNGNHAIVCHFPCQALWQRLWPRVDHCQIGPCKAERVYDTSVKISCISSRRKGRRYGDGVDCGCLASVAWPVDDGHPYPVGCAIHADIRRRKPVQEAAPLVQHQIIAISRSAFKVASERRKSDRVRSAAL